MSILISVNKTNSRPSAKLQTSQPETSAPNHKAVNKTFNWIILGSLALALVLSVSLVSNQTRLTDKAYNPPADQTTSNSNETTTPSQQTQPKQLIGTVKQTDPQGNKILVTSTNGDVWVDVSQVDNAVIVGDDGQYLNHGPVFGMVAEGMNITTEGPTAYTLYVEK